LSGRNPLATKKSLKIAPQQAFFCYDVYKTGTQRERNMKQDLNTTDIAERHLLVIDDDKRIRELLSLYLQEQDFRVTTAASAQEARRAMDGLVFDAIILDVMMPGESGHTFLETLRKENSVPVLMLTARSETEDRILGLELGSDDYLTKPFDPRELTLRLNNLFKRSSLPKQEQPDMVRFGPFVYTFERGELRKGEESIRLTDRERTLLKILGLRAGETVPRQDLVSDQSEISERAIDVQINRLRRKVERDPANPIYLQTVRGIGYRLVV
jgi:two-component system phosphate regulon response regulator OmpR